MKCEICSSAMSNAVEELFALPTVTSDCRPWMAGRSVQICSGCGVMKRVVSPFADFASCYDGYISYPEPTGRTRKILDFVNKMFLPCHIESILDVGTGTGYGIKILSECFPSARVNGYDPYSDDFKEKPIGKFDLITLFHVLEHVGDVFEMLDYVKSSLTNNGQVLIQVPYAMMWPFDLILADHTRHFTMESLRFLLYRSGLQLLYIGNNCIQKEITILAVKGELLLGENHILEHSKSVEWLLNYKRHLDTIDEPVAVYGTGPAAAWAGSILRDKARYYLDDDINRMGNFNGKLVDRPHNALPVIAPFPDWQLEVIKEKHHGLRFL